ncbi:ArsR family transcriptional regulator [Xaviernesmea oryzae]|uniref:ArsR family transcriptional regulator n=2 Tax=Xaviernesmea oryzae TaxID=464029 RepID=A0A1Q9AVN5_9HYPH|nr:ArsR family transcriptional regulator [Xaviernesmea oryzae]
MTLPRDGAVDEPSKTPEVAASASPVSHLSTSSSVDPRVEALVNDLIGRVADKWTMLILDLLAEKGELRFSQIGREIGTISQKMLTQTLRQMERDGLVRRTIHPVIPPRVDYRLTTLGLGLGEAFCGVWLWAEANLAAVDEARRRFDAAKTG